MSPISTLSQRNYFLDPIMPNSTSLICTLASPFSASSFALVGSLVGSLVVVGAVVATVRELWGTDRLRNQDLLDSLVWMPPVVKSDPSPGVSQLPRWLDTAVERVQRAGDPRGLSVTMQGQIMARLSSTVDHFAMEGLSQDGSVECSVSITTFSLMNDTMQTLFRGPSQHQSPKRSVSMI